MNFSKYIDIPFKHRGRDFSGCDCYGLVRLIYKEELGIDLPDYLEIDYNCNLNDRDETHIQDGYQYHLQHGWNPVKPPFQLYDALVFYASARKVVADHIGLYIDDGKFIHTSAHYKMSMVSRLDRIWEAKLYGGARYFGKS